MIKALRSALVITLLVFTGVHAEDVSHPTDPVFRMAGIEYQSHQLPLDIQKRLYDARLEAYKKQKSILDEALLGMELSQKAKASGKTVKSLSRELFSVEAPSEQEMKGFYEAAKAQIPYPYEQVKGQIAQLLEQREIAIKQSAWLSQLKAEKWYEIALKEPIAPLATIASEGFPSKGAADAALTIVEFADYQCPHCKTASKALKQVLAKYEGKVKLVFMDFPVNRSGISREVAKGAACADQQGKFWPFHDAAFEMQAKLSKDSPRQLAASLGLDKKAFDACLTSDFPEQRLMRSLAEAKRLGVESTPTLYLNGRLLHLHDVESELPQKIDALLAEAKNV